jgi:uncharacterized protein
MDKLIEVTIDSIRVSLMSPHRLVLLKDTNSDRYLSIWIGACESDAITAELQKQVPPRPLTHDLLKTLIEKMGGEVQSILISDLREDVYYAKIVVAQGNTTLEIDARPSDAIALAVRVNVRIYVQEGIMDRAAITPDAEVATESSPAASTSSRDDNLNIFRDFVDTLSFDNEDPDKDKD